MDASTVVTLIENIAGGKPGADLSGIKVASYHLVLRDFPDGLADDLARHFLKNPSPYFPSAGEVYHAACDLTDGHPSGPEAWALALDYLRGNRQDVPPLAQKVLRQMGGYQALQKAADQGIHRAQFLKAYEAERMAER